MGGRLGKRGVYLLLLMLLISILPRIKTSSSIEIVIDGDVSDWDLAGISPACVDPVGDTEAWSRNASIVGVGSTAEPPEMVEANDKCRDLKALYIACDKNWIYIRLDVARLYTGWSELSGKMVDGTLIFYSNVSCYHIYFDAAPEGQSSSAQATDMDFAEGGFLWDFNIQFDAAWDGVTYSRPFLQFPDWSGVSVEDFAVDLDNSAFEMRLNRTFIEGRINTALTTLKIFVGSVKQGEPTGQWGTWAHSFDPQHPGCPGEAGWGACGPELDRGHDFADWMPNEATIEPPRGEWWEDWNSHFLGPPITVELAAAVIPVHDITIIEITPSPREAFVGDEVTVSVTVKNNGTVMESLNLKLYYDGKLIESQNLTLSPGESRSISFTWKTTGLSAGEYTFRAEVPAVSGEISTADNVRTLVYQLRERVLFPIAWIIAVAVVVVVLAVLAIYLLKVRRKV